MNRPISRSRVARKTTLPACALLCAACSLVVGGVLEDNERLIVGTYVVTVTHRESICAFRTWEGGAQTEVEFVIEKRGDGVAATVSGEVGDLLLKELGTNTFEGSASGSSVDLVLEGKRLSGDGPCSYRLRGRMTAKVSGESIRGEIRYTAVEARGCPGLENCVAIQTLEGRRVSTARATVEPL